MRINSPEPVNPDPEYIRGRLSDFEKLKQPGDARLNMQLEKLSVEAKGVAEEIFQLQKTADSGALALINIQYHKFQKIYNNAVALRDRQAGYYIRQALNIREPNTSLHAYFTKQLETSFPEWTTEQLEQLEPILAELDFDASKANPGDEGTRYRTFQSGGERLKVVQMEKDVQMIEKMKEVGHNNTPLNDLQRSIRTLLPADPIALAQSEIAQGMNQHITNYEVPRVVGAALATIVGAIGVGITIFSKDHKISPATVAWLAIAAKLGGFLDAKTPYDFLATQDAQKLVQMNGIQGKPASEAVAAYMDIQQGAQEELKALYKKEHPTMADISDALGLKEPEPGKPVKTNTPQMKLLALLKSLPNDATRMAFLKRFDNPNMDPETRQEVLAYIENRGNMSLV